MLISPIVRCIIKCDPWREVPDAALIAKALQTDRGHKKKVEDNECIKSPSNELDIYY